MSTLFAPDPTSTPSWSVAEPPWMAVARAEKGVRIGAPDQSNPRITDYHVGTNLRGYDDKVAWCSSFTGWCLAQVGLAGTGSGLARSWLTWGEPLAAPRAGCIVVLYRDDPASWKGHVGFYLRHDTQSIHLLGGNQLDCVCENTYPLAALLAYRWPSAAQECLTGRCPTS